MLRDFAKNRTTEKDIRAWLNANGFKGKAVEVIDVELHAVKRPGWLQIFRFRMRAGTTEYFGVVRDDERLPGKEKTQIELFESAALQEAKLAELSDDLIVQGAQPNSYLAFLFVLGILLLTCTAAMFKFFSGAP